MVGPYRHPRLILGLGIVAAVMLVAGIVTGTVRTGLVGSHRYPTSAPIDMSAVRAHFTDECRDPVGTDKVFCSWIVIGAMTANGGTLNVPTKLPASDPTGLSTAICYKVADSYRDAAGRDLGYSFIGVWDSDGGRLASCPQGVP